MYCGWYPCARGYKTYCGSELNRKPKNFIFCPFCGEEIELLEYKGPGVAKLYSERTRIRRVKGYEKENSAGVSDSDSNRDASAAG